jgi:hypothetical protein
MPSSGGASPSFPASGSDHGTVGPRDPGSGPQFTQLSRLAPAVGGSDPPQRPTRPPAVRPGRQFTDRDWTILIDCTADALILLPSRQRIPVSSLPRRATADNPLAQAVSKMIERRQALLPAGEPPYRPRIRFLVRAEGLRTYYLAYPALESLQLPMTRQDVQVEEENRR